MQVPGPCAFCGRVDLVHTCALCGKQLCGDHTPPPQHACAASRGPRGPPPRTFR